MPRRSHAARVLPTVAAAAWRRLKKQGRSLRSSDPDAEFHELRKRAKRVRYTAELIAPIMGGRAHARAGGFIRLLTQIQDTLGEHQDAVVAAGEIEHVLAEHAHDPAFVRAANSLLASQRQGPSDAPGRFFKVWDKLDRKKLRRWMKIAHEREGRELKPEVLSNSPWHPAMRDTGCVSDEPKRAHALFARHPRRPSRTVKDPVCGMDVVPATAAGSVDHDGRTYYFCSRHCVEKFRADPARYLGDGHAQRASAHVAGVGVDQDAPCPPAHGATYTCPMHPEIVRDGPGSCPICGMALEPMTVSADDDVDPELDDMSRRFWFCLVLTIPLLLLSMAEMVPGLSFPELLTGRALVWIQFALAAPVVLVGRPAVLRAGLGFDRQP